LHKFEKTDNEFYNLWGPSCSSNPKFLETKVITIEDIIRINGERIPSYDSSKKDFNVGIVVLVPHGSEIDYDFVNYVNKYKQAIPEGWQIATNNKSTMTVCS
ncbi:MAG: hypothetical protein PHX27_03675, partial [Candidatus ainarchaeum sp.]|nr:hypothetical protein [Candidatus ainarchaeum sp.]